MVHKRNPDEQSNGPTLQGTSRAPDNRLTYANGLTYGLTYDNLW